MKIILLQDKARVIHEGEAGYLTETNFRGNCSIGMVTDAGVFRPVTETRFLSNRKAGGSPIAYSVLPEYLNFIETLRAQGIVGRVFDRPRGRDVDGADGAAERH